MDFRTTEWKGVRKMSSIRAFEFFHGGVIVKLLRSDKPITLRMIETRPVEAWSTYTLNDTVDLFVKYSKAPRSYNREGGGTSWTFPFSKNQLHQINNPNNRDVYIALVCVYSEESFLEAPVCLLKPEQIKRILDFESINQSITLRVPKRGQFRVLHERRESFYVPKSELQRWDVPGS